MSKNLVANFQRGRKCIFCRKYTLSILGDKRIYCKTCKKRYSLKKLRTDLEVLHYFCLELSARKAALDLGLSYNTVKHRYDKFRRKIAEFSDESFEKLSGEVEIDETYFGGKRKGKRGRGAFNKAIVFGILERNGKVHIAVVPNVKAKTLMNEIKTSTQKGSVFYTDCFKSYKSLKQFGKHHKINHQKTFGKGHNHINGLEGFWSFAKERFRKYHGINMKNYTLYLKEMEYRYNNRNKKLINEVIKIVFKR